MRLPVSERPPLSCGFCGEAVEQLGVDERPTYEGKIFVLSCPHCGAVLAAAGLGGADPAAAARLDL